jgi:hypothetical protein
MTAQELRIWEGMISQCWAEETLRDKGGSLDSRSVYTLMLLATGDREQAAKAAARRALDESRPR